MTARTFAAKSLLFASFLGLSSLAIKSVDRFEDVEGVGAKLSHVRERRGEYDVLFVGSSRVLMGFSPATFDAALARRGVSTRSFNFGVAGMRPPETYFVVDLLLDEGPPYPEWVLVELDHYLTDVPADMAHTRRDQYWRTPAMAARLLRATIASEAPAADKAERVRLQADAVARNLLSLGLGQRYVDSALGAWKSRWGRSVAMGPRRDGFRGLYEETALEVHLAKRRRYLEGERAVFERKAAELRECAARGWRGRAPRETRAAVDHLEETLARIRAVGARPVLVVMPPRVGDTSALHEIERNGIGAEVLAFDDPDRYPTLYDPENMFDVGHLKGETAEEFSEILAGRFAEVVARGTAPGVE
jgi:hypothetical protein